MSDENQILNDTSDQLQDNQNSQNQKGDENSPKTPVLKIMSKDDRLKQFEQDIASLTKELENSQKSKEDLQSKIELLTKQKNITAEILKAEVAELNAKFENAGLKISEKGAISVLDYSKYKERVENGFSRFDSDLERTKNDFERLASDNNGDYGSYIRRIDDLLVESARLKELFIFLNEFMLNPPSKEFMALMNNTLAIRKIAQDYKEFESIADITNIKKRVIEQNEAVSELDTKIKEFQDRQNKLFEDGLNQIDNFRSKLRERINSASDSYKTLAENMIGNLNDQLKAFEINLQSYKEAREAETRLLNKLKKGGYALTGLLFLMCLALGGIIGYAMTLTK